MLVEVMKFLKSEESQELDMSHLEILVLITLANFTGENSKCWPKKHQLIKICRTSDTTLRRILASLTGKGLIRIEPRDGKENMYYITLPMFNNVPTPATWRRGSANQTPATIGGGQGYTPAKFDRAIEKSNYSQDQKQLTTSTHTNFSRTKNEQNHRPYPSAGRKPKDPVRERLRELAREAGLETWLEDFDEDANAVPTKI